MLARLIDRVKLRLAPHSRLISVLAAVWFWIGIAIQARFVPLPDLPRALEAGIFWAGVLVNAVWWGFLHPAIVRRRRAREAAADS